MPAIAAAASASANVQAPTRLMRRVQRRSLYAGTSIMLTALPPLPRSRSSGHWWWVARAPRNQQRAARENSIEKRRFRWNRAKSQRPVQLVAPSHGITSADGRSHTRVANCNVWSVQSVNRMGAPSASRETLARSPAGPRRRPGSSRRHGRIECMRRPACRGTGTGVAWSSPLRQRKAIESQFRSGWFRPRPATLHIDAGDASEDPSIREPRGFLTPLDAPVAWTAPRPVGAVDRHPRCGLVRGAW